MNLRLKKLLLSALIAAAVNAGCVLFMEYVVKSVDAEVIVSTVICLLWVIFAAVFCRKESKSGNEEN